MTIEKGDVLVNVLELSKIIEIYDVTFVDRDSFVSNIDILDENELKISYSSYRLNKVVLDSFHYFYAISKSHEIFRRLLCLQ